MKTTKDSVFEFIQKEALTNEKYIKAGGISTNVIAETFNLQRTNASTLLNELVKEGKLNKSTTRPVIYSLISKDDSKKILDDTALIGENGSLAKPLQIAKAAILYPKKNLNLLVTGKGGCGLTHFVYAAYWYGVYSKVFKKGGTFFKVDCRHFVDNIEEVDELLFRKENIEESYFFKAKGGMLFIDNADLLSSKQKALLFDFLHSGYIYNNDHTERLACDDTFIVVGCNPNSANQFRNVIPMVVELSELKDRPLSEKLDLINLFFSHEADNAKRDIEIKKDVIEALLLTEFPHNIKELQMEILKACATACVRVMDNENDSIDVTIYDFSIEVQKSLMKLRSLVSDNSVTNEINNLLGNHNLFIYSKDSGKVVKKEESNSELYDELKSQYDELSKRGADDDIIHNVINNHVDSLFKHYRYFQSNDTSYDVEQLSKIVNPEIIPMVEKLVNLCKKELNRDYKSHVFYGLCLHMNSLLTLPLDHSRVEDDKIIEIINKYPKEYAITSQFAQLFKEKFNKELPIEEIVIITMFLVNDDETIEGHPKLLYIFHGDGIASGLKEATNSLTHTYNTYAYDLLLDKDNEIAQKEISDLIQNIDDGSGVIVIYDMGSIKTMLNAISEKYNTKIRYIYFPITLVGLEVARKCVQENDLDSVYHTTMKELQNIMAYHDNRKDAIITLCHTGEGGAIQLKRYIDQYSKLGMKTIPLSISDREDLINQVIDIRKAYHIHSFVGTYDPRLMGIPFISMAKIFENKPEDIDTVLSFSPIQSNTVDYNDIYDNLEKQFKVISINKIKTYLPSVIDNIADVYSLDGNQKTGLFVHIAALLENIKEGNKITKEKDYGKVIESHKEDFDIIYKILKPLEKKFDLIISDAQIATIVRIVNRI